MKQFVSFSEMLRPLLYKIVSSHEYHARWINTLSYLENSGARKIAACEHPTFVRQEMLKHAAEEFRHAFYLKKQMAKIPAQFLEDFSRKSLMGGLTALHYLNALDIKTCRYLSKIEALPKEQVKKLAYFLVTYVIELRAQELYMIYHEVLREVGSKVNVISILKEEKEHLNEMLEGLKQIPDGLKYADELCLIEGMMFRELLHIVNKELVVPMPA